MSLLNTLENKINYKNFWYIACKSDELTSNAPIQRTILNEWIALFRDEDGRPVALRDRCPHRNFKLSQGYVRNGKLQCPYHGWVFDKSAEVTAIPSEGERFKKLKTRCAHKFSVMELDDFIYVRLEDNENFSPKPFRMPFYKQKGYKTVRLFNVFKNNVTNCAENYIDVPHTVFVHDKIFRVSRNEKIDAIVERSNGSVKVEYKNETDNMGWFSFFLNPKKTPIKHVDYFHMPNITSVEYEFSKGKEFYITSQSIPINDELTHVYTDLTYCFGLITPLAAPFVRYQGQSVIDQDIEVLNTQMEVIKKYGTNFSNSRADIVHVFIESIRDAIAEGKNPELLPHKLNEFDFWI